MSIQKDISVEFINAMNILEVSNSLLHINDVSFSCFC